MNFVTLCNLHSISGPHKRINTAKVRESTKQVYNGQGVSKSLIVTLRIHQFYNGKNKKGSFDPIWKDHMKNKTKYTMDPWINAF